MAPFPARGHGRAGGAQSPVISIATQWVPRGGSWRPVLPCGISGNFSSIQWATDAQTHPLQQGVSATDGGCFHACSFLGHPLSALEAGAALCICYFCYYEDFSFPLLEVNRLLLVNNFMLNFPSPTNQCGFCFLTGPWLIQNPFKNRSAFSLGSMWFQLRIPSAAWPCLGLVFGPCSLVLTQRPHITLCLHFPPGAVNQVEWFSPTLRISHLCLSRKSDESCSRSPNNMICL